MKNKSTLIILASLFALSCKTSKPQQLEGNIRVNILPAGSPDLRAAGRGAEQWHDQNVVPLTYLNDTADYGADKYYRFSWSQLETGPQQYDWTAFDREMEDAIDRRQLFSFGIMPTCPACKGSEKSIILDGKAAAYPAYLHQQMQAEPVKDWITPLSDMWVPNWNSPSYLAAWDQLCKAISEHLQNKTYKGRAYRDVVRYIDIRGYGTYGEWHEAFIVDQMSDHPPGTKATSASLLSIINSQLKAFENFQLVALLGSLDGNLLRNTQVPPEVGAHLLKATTLVGPVGIRRDNWGATDSYLRNYLDDHPVAYQGLSFKDQIKDRWKQAPVLGEPIYDAADFEGCAMGDLVNQVKRYHASSIANGNFSLPRDLCLHEKFRDAAAASGYRLQIEGGQADTVVAAGSNMHLKLYWRNAGVAPLYESREVMIRLHEVRSDSLIWEGQSQFEPRLFLPADTALAFSDQWKLPADLTPGYYNIRVQLRDPKGYLPPLPLANGGRQADGSYPLRSVYVAKSD